MKPKKICPYCNGAGRVIETDSWAAMDFDGTIQTTSCSRMVDCRCKKAKVKGGNKMAKQVGTQIKRERRVKKAVVSKSPKDQCCEAPVVIQKEEKKLTLWETIWKKVKSFIDSLS